MQKLCCVSGKQTMWVFSALVSAACSPSMQSCIRDADGEGGKDAGERERQEEKGDRG